MINKFLLILFIFNFKQTKQIKQINFKNNYENNNNNNNKNNNKNNYNNININDNYNELRNYKDKNYLKNVNINENMIIINQVCSNKGYINYKTGLCNCINDYYGYNCSLKYCPSGKSWLTPSIMNNKRYQPRVECSNMGTCDIYTGKCKCRKGFEGRACDRKSCPSSNHKTCSGHGRCMTMREVSLDFDGLTTTNPPIDYDGWDADSIMGCVCDEGYEGYDCSSRKCPWGIDPTNTNSASYEKFILKCKADYGYFSLTILGKVTNPIPYNATPGLLRYIIMKNSLAKSVRISSPVKLGDDQPSICSHSTAIETAIWFEDYLGSRPPIRVSYGDTANTRMFPNGSQVLSLSGSTPTLQMVTKYTLTCPACTNCKGKIYFKYKDSISTGINIKDVFAVDLIKNDIETLTDLINMNWPNFDIEVTSSTSSVSICSTHTSIFTISIYSDFGNLPLITLLDSTLFSSVIDVPLNISFTSNHGIGQMAECSNQGICDRKTGTCNCTEKWIGGDISYRSISSNGAGQVGSKGDCGYLDITSTICPSIGSDTCNGHGFCSTINQPCLCYDGWYGYSCEYASCPKGRAWFDEAISTIEAHQLVECSNMGNCDHQTGLCICNEGYSGSACQYFDCPYNSTTGDFCGGNGWCYNMNEYIYQTTGLTYGDSTNIRNYPDTWDAFMFHGCLCSAHTTSNIYTGNKLYPPVTSNGILSGRPVETRNLMGWKGYQCNERLCPYGPKISSNRYINGNLEVQRILCTGTSSKSFKLTFNSIWTSLTITGGMTASEIKTSIEWIPALGNVSVDFRNSQFDSVTTACHTTINASYGGFYITFLDDLGDLPTLTASNSVTVKTFQDGTIEGEECGGLSAGYCDRQTGKCNCFSSYVSSNGTNAPGRRGDCSYLNPYALKSGN